MGKPVFKKRLLDSGMYEACDVFDVNGDGILDIICGAYWYEGPDFTKKHFICDVKPEDPDYFDDFSDFGMDVDGDGKTDIVTGSWWGALRWRKNPGNATDIWKVIEIDNPGNIETIRYFDIDDCGTPEVFPNTPGQPQSFYKLNRDNPKYFDKYTISEGASGHGMGFGDMNGNGLTDIILTAGWLENPGDPLNGKWIWHPDFDLGPGVSVPVIVHDVNGDGKPDIIVGSGHNYGLFWFENTVHGFIKHEIDMTSAQYHDMVLYDIDGDGELELVTGKRYRAHCGNDPGDNDPVGIYYFKINGGAFEKNVIDYGECGIASGVGIYFWIGDLNGNGKPDIVAPGKDGLYLFQSE